MCSFGLKGCCGGAISGGSCAAYTQRVPPQLFIEVKKKAAGVMCGFTNSKTVVL